MGHVPELKIDWLINWLAPRHAGDGVMFMFLRKELAAWFRADQWSAGSVRPRPTSSRAVQIHAAVQTRKCKRIRRSTQWYNDSPGSDDAFVAS